MHGIGSQNSSLQRLLVGAEPVPGLLSEAEFVIKANMVAANAAGGASGPQYLLLAVRSAEGNDFGETLVTASLPQLRTAFRTMTEGRDDGEAVYAFVVMFTINDRKIVDSQWWADARHVNTASFAPVTANERAARAALGWA